MRKYLFKCMPFRCWMINQLQLYLIYNVYRLHIYWEVFLPLLKCMQTTVFCPNLNLPRQGCVRNIAVIVVLQCTSWWQLTSIYLTCCTVSVGIEWFTCDMFETNAVVLITLPSCDHKVLDGFGHTGSHHIEQFALVFACICLCPCQVIWGLSLLRTCINMTFDIEIPAFFNCVVTKIRTSIYWGRVRCHILDELSHLHYLLTAFLL